jgi:deazaflavin-dependent oxidoreductase (nitroreductase family)
MWDSSQVGVPGPVSTLLLTTRGRRTGKERHAPLLYVGRGDAYAVIGSKGGDPDDPVWYRNLQSHAECEIRVGAYRTKARARTLEGEERDAVWRDVVHRHPVFLKYQMRTDRQIPVILLEPIRAGADPVPT